MNELSGQAQALIEAGRADAPRAAAKAAVKAGVLAKVGAAPIAPMGAEASAAAASGGIAKVGLASVLAFGLVAGAVYLATPSEAPRPEPASVAAPAEPAAPAAAREPVVEAAPEPRPTPRRARARPAVEPTPTPVERTAPPAEPVDPATRLAAEARLLGRVRVALRERRYDAVLGLVAEHADRFPAGVLVEERLAAEALAQCGLGARGAAAAARARLEARAPRSIHLSRIDDACR